MSKAKPPRKTPSQTHTPVLLWIQAAFGERRTGPREALSESQLPPSSNRKTEPYLRGVNAKLHRTMKLCVHSQELSRQSVRASFLFFRLLPPKSGERQPSLARHCSHTVISPTPDLPSRLPPPLSLAFHFQSSRAALSSMVATCGPLAFETRRVRIITGCKHKILDSEDAG